MAFLIWYFFLIRGLFIFSILSWGIIYFIFDQIFFERELNNFPFEFSFVKEIGL